MAKRKLPMNEAELERYRDNIELKQVRGEIRNHFATGKGPVPIILTSRLAELKFKRKFLGLHARSVAVGGGALAMKEINTNLSELAEGSLQERFDHEMAKIAENIMDLNTDPEKKRKITITLTMTADEYRDEISLEAEVKSTLVPRKAVSTRALIDSDGTDIYVNELKAAKKARCFFDPTDSKLKDDHGKPVEEIEQEQAEQQVKKSNGVIKFIDNKKAKLIRSEKMTENIKDALEYAVDLADGQEVIYEEKGKVYYDETKARLVQLDRIKYAAPLEVHTLSGLVGYLKEQFDKTLGEKLLIYVASPTKVNVYSELDADRKRESAIVATADLDRYPFGKFLDSEKFIINILSLFERDENSEAIRRCASAIRIEGGGDLIDDGVSQVVTVKQGAATKGQAEVPSPVELRPYRTFLEVEQPASPFVFRIDKDGDCALFEADGGMWKNHAIGNVVEYLTEAFEAEIESGFITIIG